MELEQLIFEHAERGGIVILTTHHPLQVTSGKFKKIQLSTTSIEAVNDNDIDRGD
ncbi:MAG: hypothetical protein JKY67_18600 [Pseudomonadales bacterium]|nr:hypothetical protein [Pseudomonadales bacterium]